LGLALCVNKIKIIQNFEFIGGGFVGGGGGGGGEL
jgi:hypothetical protein